MKEQLVNRGPPLLFYGGLNDDRLYAQNQLSVDAALTQNIAQIASNLKGDLMSSGDGNDTIIGDSGNDVLLGGSHDDILIGGGGNDNLHGDDQGTYGTRDWSLTRQVTTDTNNVTWYQSNFTNTDIEAAATGGADVLYGQSGGDWLFGGGGTDYLDGGSRVNWVSANDVLFREAA